MCAITVWREYGEKTQGTDTKRHDIAVPPENRQLDKSIARYIIRALLLMILLLGL